MLADELVFSVEGEEFRWRDVLLAAVRWGEWIVVERRARHGAACVRHAEATGDPLAAGALDAAGREFRYARDLVTAQSMEEWLSRWTLSAREWTGYLRRELNRGRWPTTLDALSECYPVSDEDAARLALVDAICGRDMDRWARTLAARAAAVRAIDAGPAGEGGHDPAQRIQQVDESFEQFRATQITEPALESYVGSRQLDWLRFDCRIMAFPNESMAAEAALLLREDGEGFTGVYSVAHTEPRAARFFFDDLETSLRDEFLRARAGDLIGPVRVENEHVLYLIQNKILPSARDPDVRRRAEEGVLQHALSQQLERRVRWYAAAR